MTDSKGTRVYGASDDLIEFEGDLRGEVGCHGTDDDEDMGVLLAFSDGTILTARYGKNGEGIWALFAVCNGSMLERIDPCNDADADPYSDVAHFKPGKLKCWAGKHAERVR
jgi:hypothetical protein